MGKKLGYRGDLFIADYKGINKNATKLLVGYNTNLGQPQMSDVSRYIANSFNGKAMPCLETARIYPNDGAVSIIVSKVRPTRSFNDSKSMIQIAATIYLDENIGDKWEVQKNGDKIFLSRVDDNDISEIVRQRVNNMQIKASVVTFNKLKGSESIASVQKGDTVKFFYQNQEKEGKVLTLGPAKATIKSNGDNIVVDIAAIFEVVSVSSENKKETSDALRKYFEKAYPGNYGDTYINLYK